MECELNGRTIKYENGELYWKGRNWIKFKQSLTSITKYNKDQYKVMTIYGRKFRVHRVMYYIYNQEWDIMDNSKENQIDHIDRNTINNNINNLRIATARQNVLNRVFKGVSKDGISWRARIMVNGVNKNLGHYKTEEEAIEVYKRAKAEIHII